MEISPKDFKLILIGIFMFILFFDSKFRGFLLMAAWCFLIATLQIFDPIASRIIKVFLFIVTLSITGIVAMVEADSFKKRGQKIFHPSVRNIGAAVVLVLIYIFMNIYYFDN